MSSWKNQSRLAVCGLMIGSILMVLLLGMSAFAAGNIVDDNFNALKTGDKPTGYTIEETGGSVEIAEVPSATDKSVLLNDPGDKTIKIGKKFAPQTGVVSAEVSFMQNSFGSTAKVLRLLEGETGSPAVQIETRSKGISYKNADGSFTELTPYVEKTWYVIRVVADVKTQKADVYIGGVPKLNQVPFNSAVKNIGAFDSYTPGSSGKGHYLDNITINEGAIAAATPVSPAVSTAPITQENVASTPAAVSTIPAATKALIVDLAVTDPKTAPFWSVQRNIQTNDQQYGDRNFAILDLPGDYAGYDWIRTSADAKSLTSEVIATFKVTQEADVFVAFDDRVSVKPSWIKNWTATTDKFYNSDPNHPSFTMYKKHFAANSTVTLGPNGQSKGCIHYSVIVKGPNKPAPPAVNNNATPPPVKATWGSILSLRPDWYGSDDAIRVADNVLLYQRNNGGWYKYIDEEQSGTDMAALITPAQKEKLLKDKSLLDDTIDNNGTFTQLRYLAKVYTATKLDRFKDSFNKGFDALARAQYDNGGWPQFLIDKSSYRGRITYNDDAMINVMKFMKDVAENKLPDFTFVDKERREKAAKAVQKGIDCILNTQIRVNGKLTAWCAQHDEKTLKPTTARAYELISISGQESVGILRFLMAIENPSPSVIAAVQSAVAWFDGAKITGMQEKQVADPSKPRGWDIVFTPNPEAPPIWARFYEVETNRPFFCGRDGIKKYNLAEIEYERRTGYSWFNSSPGPVLLREYPEWQKKWAPNQNVLKK